MQTAQIMGEDGCKAGFSIRISLTTEVLGDIQKQLQSWELAFVHPLPFENIISIKIDQKPRQFLQSRPLVADFKDGYNLSLSGHDSPY